MLLYRLVFSVSLFPFLIVSAPPPATDIVSENQALTQLTGDVNTDVNQMDVVDMQVPKALQNLANFVNGTQAMFNSTAPSSNEEAEQSIVDSFAPLTDAMSTLMDNLVAKVDVFKLALEGGAIYDALGSLDTNFLESTEFLEALVTGEEFQNAIGENAEGALEKIANAEDEYEPDTIIARV